MVSEGVWMQGMAELAVSLPSQDEETSAKALRGEVYQREIRPNMTDGQWRRAVREAIRNERWFPTVAALLDYGGRQLEMTPDELAKRRTERAYAALAKASEGR